MKFVYSTDIELKIIYIANPISSRVVLWAFLSHQYWTDKTACSCRLIHLLFAEGPDLALEYSCLGRNELPHAVTRLEGNCREDAKRRHVFSPFSHCLRASTFLGHPAVFMSLVVSPYWRCTCRLSSSLLPLPRVHWLRFSGFWALTISKGHFNIAIMILYVYY